MNIKRILKEDLGNYIDDLVYLDNNHHPNLRETKEEKMELYTKERSILLIAETTYNDMKTLHGERFGLPFSCLDDNLINKTPYDLFEKFNEVIYVYSFTVRTEFQGLGIGKTLAKKFIEESKNLGFKYLCGHAKDGPAIKINEELGSEIIRPYENWFNTKNTHWFYILKI